MTFFRHWETRRLFAVLLFVPLLLFAAACGGGGSSSSPPPEPKPPVTPDPPAPAPDPEPDPPAPEPEPPASITITMPPPLTVAPPDESPPDPEPPGIDLGAPNPPDGESYAAENDLEINQNRYHYDINTEPAYQRGYWGQGVTVAILDSGALTTHSDLTMNLLPGKNYVEEDQPFPVGEVSHGTHVAGVVGAARNGRGGQGVAPSASILPLRVIGGYSDTPAAFRYALSNNAAVLNNSWTYGIAGNGTYNGKQYSLAQPIPFFHTLWNAQAEHQAREFANVLNGKDAVAVWALGNGSWREGGRISLQADGVPRFGVPIEEFINEFSFNRQQRSGFSGTLSARGITPLDAGFFASLPLEHPDITKNLLVVAAAHRFSRLAGIASFSNGCGEAKFWCLTAPGERLYSTNSTGAGAETYSHANGTSGAAPVVSGALAILKSRWRTMPMEVIRAILLTTARDMGEPGIDDTFGWGMVNVGAAITLQGAFAFNPADYDGGGGGEAATIPLREARLVFPPQFADARRRLENISVAVQFSDGVYYNMDLSDIAQVRPAPAAETGYAAADLLAADSREISSGAFFARTGGDSQLLRAGLNFGDFQWQQDICAACRAPLWREWDGGGGKPLFAGETNAASFLWTGGGLRPFFSFSGGGEDAPYRQYGLRWQKSLAADGGAAFNILAEASQISEPDNFWGADFGANAAAGGAKSRQGRLVLSAAAGQWRGGAMAETLRGNGAEDGGGGKLLTSLSNLRAHGWGAFLQRRGVFRANDRLRFSARRQLRITGGKGVLQTRRAVGDFTQAFYNTIAEAPAALKAPQTLEAQTTELDFSSRGRQTFAVGYQFSPTPAAALAIAAEYEESAPAAFSAQWSVRF